MIMKRNKFKFKFKEYNANFKNKKTTNCVIRALAVAMDKYWKDVFSEMTQQTLETGIMYDEKKVYEKYLEKNNWTKHKMPRRGDNTKYTVKEFLEELANKNTAYVIAVAGHLTVIKDLTLIDTWDCSCKSVGKYYTIE